MQRVSPNTDETRLLLMVALMMADRAGEAERRVEALETEMAHTPAPGAPEAARIEALAARIERLSAEIAGR